MGELRCYLGAFFKEWERWACGALGFVLGILATVVSVQALRVLIGLLAIAAFFIASFLVWRDEFRKTAEDPALTAERRRIFEAQIAGLASNAEIHFLRRVALNGAVPRNSVLDVLQGRTDLIIFDKAQFLPNPTYRRLLEEWALKTPDPSPQT